MLSTEKSCFAETGYQTKFHKVYIVATGTRLIFCSAKKFAKQYFLLNSLLKCLLATMQGTEEDPLVSLPEIYDNLKVISVMIFLFL